MQMSPLIVAVEEVLAQGHTLLRAVTQEAFTSKEEGLFGASVGAHYRHVLDHFFCLLDGIHNGRIDYDGRRRSPELENSLDAAHSATEDLVQKFRRLPEDTLQRECWVIYSVGYGENEAQEVPSNMARELSFCVGHAIHHFAIVRLLCAGMAIPLPREFGVAPSTLKHLKARAAA